MKFWRFSTTVVTLPVSSECVFLLLKRLKNFCIAIFKKFGYRFENENSRKYQWRILSKRPSIKETNLWARNMKKGRKHRSDVWVVDVADNVERKDLKMWSGRHRREVEGSIDKMVFTRRRDKEKLVNDNIK